jgi:hypothetical protein
MNVAKLPASVRRSLRRSKYRSDRWLTITWATVSSGLIPVLRPLSLAPVVLPIASIAAPIGHPATLPHRASHANRFVATPVEFRGPVARLDLVKARVAGPHLVGPTVSAPTIESQVSDSDKIYNAERRLQLAHAINDRSSIAQIRAELDRLF